MRRLCIVEDDNAADWIPSAIFVVGLLLCSFIFVFANSNGISSGIAKGEMAPDFTALAHQAGNDTNDWYTFRLYENLDLNWSGNYSEGIFTVIEFLDTDCPYCWDTAGKISSLDSQLSNYGLSDRVRYIFVVVELPIKGHSTSIEEIVAFQEKLSYPGCNGGTVDCSSRPGDVHPGIYIDDRSNEIFREYSPRGTPHYMILKPNGIVGWDGGQDSDNQIGIELSNLICRDGGDNDLCSQIGGE
ncbi:MAG: hypothetical protein CMB56_002755 [Methanobacteriota archaeon]|nr:MAG: hypothetical protein CMB56_002755 [Euryarchaeota archaeon]|tara:strand:+ start:57591 stop:58319 length:729 start_codon:yes stop_codon:yes gene_type:complete